MTLKDEPVDRQALILADSIGTLLERLGGNQHAGEEALLMLVSCSIAKRLNQDLPLDKAQIADEMATLQRQLGLTPMEFLWIVLSFVGAGLGNLTGNGVEDGPWVLERESEGWTAG